MAKASRVRRRIASRHCRVAPYTLPSCNRDASGDVCPKKRSDFLDHRDWEDVTCSVCMEFPHNAVLLLCSSHDKGCRPYMCGTSFRYSNCLDQYKKAYTKVIPSGGTADNPIVLSESGWPVQKCEIGAFSCPLCRGQVKGWTVVQPARDYLNSKKRNCMQDDCTFVGTFKELRKHMKAVHPSARPREVDPALEQKWRRLERERDHNDVISTIRSTMPGAMVLGDYVIERNHNGFNTDEEAGLGASAADALDGIGGMDMGFDRNLVNVFLLLHAFGPSGGDDLSRRIMRQGNLQTREETAVGIRHSTSDEDEYDDDLHDENEEDGGMSLVSRLRRHGRVLLGRSGRRRRRRAANGGQS